jgi:hypothetical protein
MFNNIKKAGMKWATSPQAMKIMTNPEFQKVLMKALQLPNDVRHAVQERTAKFADFADLATRADVQTFTRTIRDLERDVQKLKRELDLERAKVAKAATAAPPAPGHVHPHPEPEVAVESAPAAASDAPKKTKVVAKKKPAES